ncbi:MAG: carbamoyltransferase HypF, partial [Actinomycetota bacterium]|nr:carbamoyltransferase HypF [Actinomycetota bacterium]
VSARFHRGLARATAAACAAAAGYAGTGLVVLGGGVFHNRLLAGETMALLEREGLRVLTAERLPAGDGGIAFGQAAVAAAASRR